MFSKPHVMQALADKRQAFDHYEARAGAELQRYDALLDWLAGQSQADLAQRLASVARPGARPTTERVAGRPVVLPFGARWDNHQDARAWALRTLRGVPTLAVDGSQVTPSRDFSIPVGAVQVGWFENAHDPQGRYVKDIRFEVLTPGELTGEELDEAGGFPDLQVNLRRFALECETLTKAMQRMAGQRPAPVCFFDGSLIISFAAQMRPELQKLYVQAVRAMLDASEETRVPLVGFVDTSYASDVLSLLRAATGSDDRSSLSDGALLRPHMAWGDRSEAFVCARNDQLAAQADGETAYYERVHMTYLKTTTENAPARLDLPSWLLEAGELERVVDVVRAECVIGTGYPYAVETADAVAVITMEDRERFYRAFQEFLQGLNVNVRYARKAYSKRGRR